MAHGSVGTYAACMDGGGSSLPIFRGGYSRRGGGIGGLFRGILKTAIPMMFKKAVQTAPGELVRVAKRHAPGIARRAAISTGKMLFDRLHQEQQQKSPPRKKRRPVKRKSTTTRRKPVKRRRTSTYKDILS